MEREKEIEREKKELRERKKLREREREKEIERESGENVSSRDLLLKVINEDFCLINS